MCLFQVQQVRLESEEYCLKLEMTQKDAQEVKLSLEREKEQVRRELLGRIRELETLPDKLRRTEQQLRDVQQEASVHERRNMEHSSALSDVRHKVCILTCILMICHLLQRLNFLRRTQVRQTDMQQLDTHTLGILLYCFWWFTRDHQGTTLRFLLWLSIIKLPHPPPPNRWSSRALSLRHFSRGTCCCRRRTTFSKRKFTTWRGAKT